jgi:hypothetical protein
MKMKVDRAINFLLLQQVPIGTTILLTVAALPLIYKSELLPNQC